MLTRNPASPAQIESAFGSDEQASPIGIGNILTLLRRQWLLIFIGCVIGLGLAVGYVVTATPLYTASSSVLLDTQMNQFLQKQNITAADSTLDTGLVDSQVEVLTSDSIALSVIKSLNLAQDREFVGPPIGVLGQLQWQAGQIYGNLKKAVGLNQDDSSKADDMPERVAVDTFLKRLTVKRVGLTYVIDVSFASERPEKAAKIANAIADAYMTQQLTSKFESTRRASGWLQERLTQLKAQATEADAAVQSFKSASNIVDTGRGLMNQQQLADLNGQLVVAKTATAEAKARLDRIQHVDSNQVLDATVTDALNNSVITRLRAQYLDLASQEASLTARLGSTHLAAVKLRDQMGELRNAIANEVQRIADAYASDYEIAKAREKSLNDSLAGLVGEAGTSNQAQVKLRELESSADSYRTLYDSFLQKFQESIQQQSSPVTDTRIITAATVPLNKSSPKTLLALMAGALLGIFAGAGTGLARELIADVFRTADEVERATGVVCLGIVPTVVPSRKGRKRFLKSNGKIRPADRKALAAAVLCEYVLDAPFSRFTESLRNVKVSIDTGRLSRDSKVIGIVSSVPHEGKTTIAGNLANLVASAGHRALLIDGDFHRRATTLALAPSAREGLMEALHDPARLASLVQTRNGSGLDVLPCVVERRPANAAELLGSLQMASLLAAARNTYDYVFIDLAPIAPVVDAKAAAHLVDSFVFVVEWARSKRRLVVEALASNEAVRDKLAGVLLNRADPSALRRIEAYKGKAFGSYYSN